jgi:hypothetical protein
MIRAARPLALVALVLALVSCESSQDKSARIAKNGKAALNEKGLDVRKRNADVRVVERAVLQDENGVAAVVVLRNRGTAALRGVPVEIDVRNPAGKSLFKNNEAGIESSLVGPSVLPPGRDFAWVHDQVVADGKVSSVTAVPGPEKETVSHQLPELDASTPRLQGDVASGIEAVGKLTNRSDKEQRELVLYCVARRGNRIVAAGRGQVPRLKAGQTKDFHIFFIGDPRGAKLSVEAPPTTL